MRGGGRLRGRGGVAGVLQVLDFFFVLKFSIVIVFYVSCLGVRFGSLG